MRHASVVDPLEGECNYGGQVTVRVDAGIETEVLKAELPVGRRSVTTVVWTRKHLRTVPRKVPRWVSSSVDKVLYCGLWPALRVNRVGVSTERRAVTSGTA